MSIKYIFASWCVASQSTGGYHGHLTRLVNSQHQKNTMKLRMSLQSDCRVNIVPMIDRRTGHDILLLILSMADRYFVDCMPCLYKARQRGKDDHIHYSESRREYEVMCVLSSRQILP